MPAFSSFAMSTFPHPSHVRLTDVDRDGVQDLLVADLGTFFPEDHNKGAAARLLGLKRTTLVEKLKRF